MAKGGEERLFYKLRNNSRRRAKMEEVWLVFWQIVWPLALAILAIHTSHLWRANPVMNPIGHLGHFSTFLVACFCLSWALPNIAVRVLGRVTSEGVTAIVIVSLAITIVLMSLKIPHQILRRK